MREVANRPTEVVAERPDGRARSLGDLSFRVSEWQAAHGHRIDDPNNALNHHCLVRQVEGDKVTTISGNGDFQQNHIRTEPLAKYDRYRDVMSTSSS